MRTRPSPDTVFDLSGNYHRKLMRLGPAAATCSLLLHFPGVVCVRLVGRLQPLAVGVRAVIVFSL